MKLDGRGEARPERGRIVEAIAQIGRRWFECLLGVFLSLAGRCASSSP
jgi:hypothetical protein